ncbi:hypothetical protein FRB90_012121 [Tulasnella sp. 427]|nr:hypothetical protein FRB90_012121 [Tulasnella sp. 427]
MCMLRYICPKAKLYATSATLPPAVLSDIKTALNLYGDCEYIFRSNARPNLPSGVSLNDPPPKFMVFMNSKELYAAGMGIDIRDIRIVVQYQAPDSLCTLIQRWGRGARDPSIQATCLLLAEEKHFDDIKEKKIKKTQSESTSKPASLKRKAALNVEEQDHSVTATPLPKRTRMVDSPPPSPTMTPTTPTASQHIEPAQWHMEIDEPEWNSPRLSANPMLKEHLGTEPDPEASGLAPPTSAPECLSTGATPTQTSVKRPEGKPNAIANKKAKGRNKKEEASEEGGILQLINAGRSQRPKCRSAAVDQYFSNHTAKPSTCCDRCASKTPTLCCDICHPDAFPVQYLPSDPPPTTTRAPNRSNIKPQDDNVRSKQLHDAIVQWRKCAAAVRFKTPHFIFGDSALLSNEAITRITICAAAGKLADAEAFRREVHWIYSDNNDYVADLLALVQISFPEQAAAKNSKASSATGTSGVPLLQKRKVPSQTVYPEEGSLHSVVAVGHMIILLRITRVIAILVIQATAFLVLQYPMTRRTFVRGARVFQSELRHPSLKLIHFRPSDLAKIY